MMYLIRGCNFAEEKTIIETQAKARAVTELRSFDFTSGRKRMTSFSSGHGDGYGIRAQMKGASEIVLGQCS